jgi:hypothetical protein
MENRGIKTEIGNLNRQIIEQNKMTNLIDKQINHYERSLENERTRSNGTKNRGFGDERGNTKHITDILLNGKSNQVDSSRASDTIKQNKQDIGRKQDRQAEFNKDPRREQSQGDTNKRKGERIIQGTKSEYERPQRIESSKDRKDISVNARGSSQEPREPQGNGFTDKGHGVSPKENTESIMERESQAIHSSTTSNNRLDSGISGNLPTSEPFGEILQTLSKAIEKADNIQKSKEKSQKEPSRSKQQPKNKTRIRNRENDWEMER